MYDCTGFKKKTRLHGHKHYEDDDDHQIIIKIIRSFVSVSRYHFDTAKLKVLSGSS